MSFLNKINLLVLKKFTRRKPLLASIIIFMCVSVFCTVIEQMRAWYFMKEADDFATSAQVQTIQSDVDRLNRSVQAVPASLYCELTASNLLADFNVAYLPLSSGDNAPEKIVDKINEGMASLQSTPSFRSIWPFIPLGKDARDRSEKLRLAITEMKRLSNTDVRSKYCLAAQEALARIYFAQTLRESQGVAVLLPGQIENFQTNTKQALELLTALPYPAPFADEHISLSESLASLQRTLQGDTDNYKVFAQQVDADMTRIESILASIKQSSEDLQDRPAQMAIAVADIK